MNNNISKSASVFAGIIIFLLLAVMFVGFYVLIGLWSVIVPAVIGAFVGSKRFDSNNVEGFTQDDINYYVDPKVEAEDDVTIH